MHKEVIGDAILYLGDCREVLPEIGKVDACLTDPPYGIGLDAWDKPVDLNFLIPEIKKRANDFFCFFGQFPTIADWHNSSVNYGLRFLEHITWVKRVPVPSFRLSRVHEDILIYSLNGKKKFYETKGRFEDVKIPGILVDTITLEGIDRVIKDLRLKSLSTNYNVKIKSDKNNVIYSRFRNIASDRSPDFVNFTNVWSFLPPTRADKNNGHDHPTKKPVEMMERLVEIMTDNRGEILDPFMGSGSTGVACMNLGRKFIGVEIEKKYFDIACERIENAQRQKRMFA